MNKQVTFNDRLAVEALLNSPSFKTLLRHCQPSRTLLGILQDAFHENVLSRLLRFLCCTNEPHELGDAFLRAWLKEIPNSPFCLGRGQHQIDAFFNWSTGFALESRRYVDVVLVIRRKLEAEPIAIVAIETKIQAAEGNRQLEDYQIALNKRFSRVARKFIMYLTPDGISNKTSKIVPGCDCIDVPYATLVRACANLNHTAGSQSKISRELIKDLAEFLEKDLMRTSERGKIIQLVKQLERDPVTTKALEILRGLSHRPTVRSMVYELVLPMVAETIPGTFSIGIFRMVLRGPANSILETLKSKLQ